MGILGRINTIIKSNVNDVLDKMTDPAKEIDLLVYDMEKNLKQAKQEVITSTATAKRTGMRCRELEDEVETWTKRAEQAVRAGEDDLAREALQEKMSVARELEASDKIYQEQLSYVSQLKSSLKALEARVKEVKLRKETLKARARSAKEGHSGLKQPKAFEDFNRLEGKIDAMAEEAELTDSLDGRDAATNAKFAQLEREMPDQKVEDALAELKRKMEQ